MALPEVRSVGAIAASTGTITPGEPSSSADADLWFGFYESGGAAASGEATPSLTNLGWKPIPAAWGGPIAVQNGNTKLTVLYKWVPANEARRGPTNDTGDHQMGRIIDLKAGTFDPEQPIHAVKTSTQSSTTSVSITGLTTSLNECLIIAASAGNLPDATGTTQFASVANGKLGSVTERIDNTTAEGDGGALFVATGTLASKGETGATTVTASNAAVRANVTIAIAPFKAPERPYQVGPTTMVTFGSRSALEFSKPSGEAGDQIYIHVYSTKKAKLPENCVFESEGQASGGAFRDELIRIPYSSFPATLKIEWEGGGSAESVGELVVIRNNDPAHNIVGTFKTEASKTVKLEALTSTFKNGLARAWAANTSGTSPGSEPGGESGMWWERVRYSPAVFEKSLPGEEATGTIEWELGGVSVTWAGNSIILAPISKGQNVSATIATETDSAVKPTPTKRLAPAPTTETDSAVTPKAVHRVTAGKATETDSAIAPRPTHRVTVTPATETDVARSPGRKKGVTPATEVDSAVTPTGRHFIAATRATETDVAVAPAHTRRLSPSPATETDSALSPAHTRRVAVTPGTETDTARIPGRKLGPAKALEVDSAVTPRPTKRVKVTPATETDVAVSPRATHRIGSGIASETDAAVAVSHRRVIPVAPATEVDTARSPGRKLGAGPATEVDTAIAPSFKQGGGKYTASPAIEVDSALPGKATKRRAAGLSTETDAAVAPKATKRVSAGIAVSVETAIAPRVTKRRAAGRADEVDVALAPKITKRVTAGVAVEVDQAVAPRIRHVIPASIATEVDVALPARATHHRTAAAALEVDTAVPPTSRRIKHVTPALEQNEAIAPSHYRRATPGTAVEVDEAIAPILTRWREAGLATEVDEALAPGFHTPLQGHVEGRAGPGRIREPGAGALERDASGRLGGGPRAGAEPGGQNGRIR